MSASSHVTRFKRHDLPGGLRLTAPHGGDRRAHFTFYGIPGCGAAPMAVGRRRAAAILHSSRSK